MARDGLDFEHVLQITATPARVLSAFFDPVALEAWWSAVRSVTTPRPLGVSAIEWETAPFEDEVLGSLGGVFHGTVMEYRAGREFFLADAYWVPPAGPPIGPMALEVSCRVDGSATRLCVRRSSGDMGARWKRYGELIATGWHDSLGLLKQYLEGGAAPRAPEHQPVLV